MTDAPRWGVVATVRAPQNDVLRFAAYHLHAGAHRVYIYLDDPDAPQIEALTQHRQVHLTRCDDAHWARIFKKRPAKHQVRQTLNATDAYARAQDLDWLAHIDVDEFITGDVPVAECLAQLAPDCFCARMPPMEPLAGVDGMFKSAVPRGPQRSLIMARLYPTWGPYLRSGLLSHTAGKLFVQNGAENVRMRIHNVERRGESNPNQEILTGLRLAHLHAPNWEHFRASFGFRLRKGSYRADLAPQHPRETGGITLHEMLKSLRNTSGDTGLLQFYNELCTARPELLQNLESEGLLYQAKLDLDAKLRKVFPGTI